MSQTIIYPRRSTSPDLFIIHIVSSQTLFWRKVLNLVTTCARVWPLRETNTYNQGP